MASEILNAWWYNTCDGKHIGIVKTKDNITGDIKFRIAVVGGLDEELDKEYIRDFGDKFYPEIIK